MDVMAGVLGLCVFSLLSLYILMLVPNAQKKIKAIFRFPLIGILLGIYIGDYYTWLTFLVVNCSIIFIFLLNKPSYKKLSFPQIISCLLLALSFFISNDI